MYQFPRLSASHVGETQNTPRATRLAANPVTFFNFTLKASTRTLRLFGDTDDLQVLRMAAQTEQYRLLMLGARGVGKWALAHRVSTISLWVLVGN